MTSRKEIVVDSQTSIHLFRDNKNYDFKVKLPINNYGDSNTVLSLKNILCKFTKNNVVQQIGPTILKTEYSEVSNYYSS